MPSQEILEWLADQGLTAVYTSDATPNPTTGAGTIIFQHAPTADAGILVLRFTFVNESATSMTYAIQTSDDGGETWQDVIRPTAHPKLLETATISVTVANPRKVRVGIMPDAASTGTSRVIVEYLKPGE